MASLYSRPIYNLRLPGHYRLHPPAGEPVFDVPIAQLPPARSHADGSAPPPAPAAAAVASSRSAGTREVQVPPPAYTGLELPLSRTISSGRTLVNPRRSKATKIAWAYHPAISGRWYFYRLFRFLKKQHEKLQSQFPDEFEEVLDEGNVDPAEQEKIRELYSARIHHLNEWMLQPLAATRLWMALVEVSRDIYRYCKSCLCGVTDLRDSGLHILDSRPCYLRWSTKGEVSCLKKVPYLHVKSEKGFPDCFISVQACLATNVYFHAVIECKLTPLLSCREFSRVQR